MRSPNDVQSPWTHAARGVARRVIVPGEDTWRLFILTFGLLSIAACGGGGSDSAAPPSPSPTLSIKVPPVVATNATLPATATVTNSSTPVTWSSEASTVATVSAAGEVTGVAPGQSVIRAVESGSLSASASINVIPRFTEIGLGIRWGCGITAAFELYCWVRTTLRSWDRSTARQSASADRQHVRRHSAQDSRGPVVHPRQRRLSEHMRANRSRRRLLLGREL